MKHATRILVVAAIAAGVVTIGAAPIGAGVPATNTVTIVKDVVGTAPAGTTFTVQVDCENDLQPGSQAITEVTFDADGTPTSQNTFAVTAGVTCTATETADGGATSVAYACAMEHGPSDQIGPPFLGNCTADNEASFGDVIGDAATITVTNTFAATPTNPPLEPVTPAAQAVQAAPTFTG